MLHVVDTPWTENEDAGVRLAALKDALVAVAIGCNEGASLSVRDREDVKIGQARG